MLGIVQARLSSSRLPGKVLLPILGKPMLFLQLERIRRSSCLERLVVATSNLPEDDAVERLCADAGVACFRGSRDDVLDRYYQASLRFGPAQHVIRITGDCPLIDPAVIDEVAAFYVRGGYDYASNALEPSFPDGLDVEVFSQRTLATIWREATLRSQREHVTLAIYQHPERFKTGNYRRAAGDLSHLRWTVDEAEDFDLVRRIYEALYPARPAFTTDDVIALIRERPDLPAINARFVRNEGLAASLRSEQRVIDA